MRKIENQEILISASVSCMDMMNLKEHMYTAEQAGIDFYHFDVVDGEFNNCFILGQTLLEAMRENTELPIEVHLAVYHPIKYVKQFIDLGADYVGVHYEAKDDLQETFDAIRQLGATPVLNYRAETVFCMAHLELVRQAAWVNKLTVNPGFSGQTIQPPAIAHIRDICKAMDDAGLDTYIQADGNINEKTIPSVIEAGANILTGGTSGLFVKGRSVKDNIERMRNIANATKSGVTEAGQ